MSNRKISFAFYLLSIVLAVSYMLTAMHVGEKAFESIALPGAIMVLAASFGGIHYRLKD